MKNFFLKLGFFYFFYKVLKIFRNSKKNTHLGEFGEDIFVRRFFRKFQSGLYVDVGAYHPIKGSLTYDLYKKNWSGINVDLSKITIDLFKLSRPKDINIRAAITDFDGKTFFYENSPINQQNSLTKINDKQTKINIECYTLNSILENYSIEKLDYLNIDVEGSELKVIEGIDLKKYHPNLITIENNNLLLEDYLKDNVYKKLTSNDYVFINKIGVTNFFLDKNLSDKISRLIEI